MSMKRKTLKELIADGPVVIPGIYDCISARAIELAGYQAAFLSSAGVANSWCGLPDIGLITIDEMIWLASRITDYTSLPLVVSIENGYSDSRNATYRAVKRLVKMGVDSVVIDDTDGYRGRDRGDKIRVVPENVWLNKVSAALEAVEGTGCTVIAKSCAKFVYGLETAVDRCRKAGKLNAQVTSIEGLASIREAEIMARSVPGSKMWSDLKAKDRKLVVEPEQISQYGFNLISIYFTEKASVFGMLDFAKQSLKSGDTVYHDQHDFDGIIKPGEDYHKFFSFHKKWLPMEQRFLDVKELSELPDFVKE